MKLLSVDCSTNSFAYGILNDGELEEYGEIFFTGSEIHKRLVDARLKMEALLPDFQTKGIDYIVFEDVVTVRSVKTAASMAKMFGTVLSVILELDAKLVLVEPLKWQTAIGVQSPRGKARTDLVKGHPELKTKNQIDKFIREYRKQKIIEYVEDRAGIVPDNDNVSDGIAIGYWAYDIMKESDF